MKASPAAQMLCSLSNQVKDLLNMKKAHFMFDKIRIDCTIEVKKVSLLFRASENGWDARDFHKYCDGKGPTLSLLRCEDAYLAAGFTSKSWQSPFLPTDVEDSSAMVFALTNDLQVFKPNNPKKAVWHRSDIGPWW